jgi:hypothetical protein
MIRFGFLCACEAVSYQSVTSGKKNGETKDNEGQMQ